MSSFFAAFAIVFTMGTVTTTTSAEATCHGGCYNSCSSLKYYENRYRSLADRYKRCKPWLSADYTRKANYYRDQYNRNCKPTPPPVKTGTVCGYVLGDGKGLDNVRVTIINKSGARIAQVRTDKLGKWTISNIPEGQVTIDVNERDVEREAPEGMSFLDGPAQVDQLNTVTVKANQMNCGGLDSWVAKEP